MRIEIAKNAQVRRRYIAQGDLFEVCGMTYIATSPSEGFGQAGAAVRLSDGFIEEINPECVVRKIEGYLQIENHEKTS